MKTSEIVLYGGIAAGLWWLLGAKKSEAQARADQDNVVLPQITPVGAPQRAADNPLSDDEKQALTSGQAYLDRNGWLKYVGMDDKSSSGSVAW